MKNTLSLTVFLFCTLLGLSQDAQVKGLILTGDGTAASFANVILYNSVDSSLVKVEYSDDNGIFNLSKLIEGEYHLSISYVGFEDYNSSKFKLAKGDIKDFEALTLNTEGETLDQVTITAKKPLLELKPDKVVMNVSGSINFSGEDGLSLLRKAPGVLVDNNENISIIGKSGVQIYIDGKPSRLSSTDLANYLRSMTSDQIEAIEIITNPSAKYDAAGSAGIINIKLVRNKNHGTNGSLSANASQGILFKSNVNFNGNYRDDNWYAYTNLGAYKGQNINNNFLYRQQSGILFDQRNVGQGFWQGINTSFGLDRFINDKNTIGILVKYSPGKGDWNNNGETYISRNANAMIDSILVSEALSDWNSTNWSTNLNYKYESENGTSLNLDFDYGEYDNMNMENQPNLYFNGDSTKVLSENTFYTEAPTDIQLISSKADYETNFLKGKLSTGIKYSSVKTNNSFDFSKVIDGQRILDISQSNDFSYNEEVSAGYLNYAQQINQLNVQLGLRAEHTHSEGNLEAMIETENEFVEKSYLDFFPNLALSYQLNPKNSFNLSYSRRLDRPNYQDLNPFSSRLDELTFEQGNPFLTPEYANNIQLGHAWNYKINTSLSYSHTKDLISRIVSKVDQKTTNITWINLEDQQSYSINVSSPIPIKEWWSSYTSLTGVRTSNSATLDENLKIDLTVYTFNIYSQHSFNLPKGYRMEISGWYSSPSVWEGNVKMNKIYSIDMGFTKSFLEDKLRVKLAFGDIFKTNKWSGFSQLGDLAMNVSGDWDSRRVKLNLNYRFGNSDLKKRKRNTGLEEAQNRIKSGS